MTGRVLVWRNEVLPISETFIRNQVEYLTRWQAVLCGRTRTTPSLEVQRPTWALQDNTSRLGLRLLTLRARSKKLDRYVENLLPDLIHAHFGFDSTLVRATAHKIGCPFIVTFHGRDVSALAGKDVISSLYRARLPRVFDEASLLIAVSPFVKERLLALGAPAQKVQVHHIGIPIDGGPRAHQERRGIVFVGRLVEKKGIFDLADAMRLLPSSRRDTAVTIVGDGPLRRDAENYFHERNINAEFVGSKSSSEIRELLPRYELLCAPSKTARDGDSEGFGLVFLEAALAGIPAVSYKHGGVPSAVIHRKTGLLAREGDVAALSGHIAFLLERPQDADALGRAGRARVLKEFDLRNQTKKLEQLYDTVIENSMNI